MAAVGLSQRRQRYPGAANVILTRPTHSRRGQRYPNVVYVIQLTYNSIALVIAVIEVIAVSAVNSSESDRNGSSGSTLTFNSIVL